MLLPVEKGQLAISRKFALVEAATRTRNGYHFLGEVECLLR